MSSAIEGAGAVDVSAIEVLGVVEEAVAGSAQTATSYHSNTCVHITSIIPAVLAVLWVLGASGWLPWGWLMVDCQQPRQVHRRHLHKEPHTAHEHKQEVTSAHA